MDYIELIERVIDYIETHLEDEISLEKLAMQENFSSYYFHRIFSALVGESLASYIRDRRLNASLKLIRDSSKSLTEIALFFNFSSQSSFIRCFKNKYHTTPKHVRIGKLIINEVDPPDIVKRSIMNFNSDLVTKFKLIHFMESKLCGIYMSFDLTEENFREAIRQKTKAFFEDYRHLTISRTFQVIFDCKSDKENLKMFIGFLTDDVIIPNSIQTLIIPEMLVAEFKYEGDLLDVGDIIGKDLMRWSKLSKKNLHNLGISAIHELDIKDTKKMFKIIIPIEESKDVEY